MFPLHAWLAEHHDSEIKQSCWINHTATALCMFESESTFFCSGGRNGTTWKSLVSQVQSPGNSFVSLMRRISGGEQWREFGITTLATNFISMRWQLLYVQSYFWSGPTYFDNMTLSNKNVKEGIRVHITVFYMIITWFEQQQFIKNINGVFAAQRDCERRFKS